MMKKYFKQEIRYGLNSKIYYMITLFLMLLFGVTLFFNYSSVNDTYNGYLDTLDYYEKNNLDIDEDLASEYELEETKKGEQTITNPIPYYKETISKFVYAASPKYILSQLLESSTLYFPLVFGMLGLLIATYDFKYKTIKLKTVRMDKVSFVIAKQLSIAFISFIILVIGLMISYLVAWFMFRNLSANIPISEFVFNPGSPSSSIIIKFIFGYMIALIFAIIGFTFGTVFKNVFVGLISIIVYLFMLPNLGTYDLKNSIYYFANRVFDFYGVIIVEAPKEDTTFLLAILVFLFVFILSFITNVIVIKKRSSFES